MDNTKESIIESFDVALCPYCGGTIMIKKRAKTSYCCLCGKEFLSEAAIAFYESRNQNKCSQERQAQYETTSEVKQHGDSTETTGVASNRYDIISERIGDLECSQEHVALSVIAAELNKIKTDNSTKFRYEHVASWLRKLGVIERLINQDTGSKKDRITKIGYRLGISEEVRDKKGDGNTYTVIVYNKNAQGFIIQNYKSLLKFLNTGMLDVPDEIRLLRNSIPSEEVDLPEFSDSVEVTISEYSN